jgi:hypothetical protein
LSRRGIAHAPVGRPSGDLAAGRPEAWLGQRVLLSVLAVLLTMTTAIALLITALTLFPYPAPAARPAAPASDASAPTPFPARAVPPSADRGVTLARSQPIAVPPGPLLVALARLTYQPGTSGGREALPGPLLLIVDAGALAARLDTPGRLHRATVADASSVGVCRGDCRLDAGDSLLLPSMTVAAFQSIGAAPAVVWAAAVLPAAATEADIGRVRAALGRADPPRWAPAWSPGALVSPLAGGWAIDLDAPAATLTLARLSLDPGADGTLPAVGTQALTVETGALTLETEHGLVWLQRPGEGDEWLEPTTPATLLSGESALLQAGASARLRDAGAGPLQLAILTVAPADAPEATPAGTPT